MLELVLKALIIAACGFVSTLNAPVRKVLRLVDRSPVASEDQEVRETRANLGLAQAEREMPGGRWVGLTERIATYACIVAGFPAGIAVVVAVKGLGRYAELVTDSKAGSSRKGELFIIGTFVSLLWASAFAGLAYGLVRLW